MLTPMVRGGAHVLDKKAKPMDADLNPNLIAITGIGCRYPGGANSVSAFWDLLRQGKDAIGEVPASRFDIDSLFSEAEKNPGSIRSRKGGFLDQIGHFDADFFNISPREAISMDPQQRLLLECGFEALEDSGLTLDQVKGSNACVYVGSFNSDYESLMFHSQKQLDLYSVIGGGRYSMSNRLSYFFDLRGESMQIDTACSSSLVALNLACQQLRSGAANLALIGGCNTIINPYLNIGLSYSQVLSKSGRCNFGGVVRDGYARSEGIGVLALRPLHVALAENNPVYATILASGVNNDGKSSGLLLYPSAQVQGELMERVWRQAGINRDQVDYIEAHGTGTKAGDPVELQAIHALLQGRSGRAYVGSVKSNIGHCEGGSAIASLVKIALMIKHGTIVPSLVVGEVCPELQAPDRPFEINAQAVAWPEGQRRVAAINSFGMTGTNAHAVLASPPAAPAPTPAPVCNHSSPLLALLEPLLPPLPAQRPASQPPLFLIPISAKSRTALRARMASLLEWSTRPELANQFYDLAYTLALRRNLFGHRVALAASNLAQFQTALESALSKPDLGIGSGLDLAGGLPSAAQAAAPLGLLDNLVFVFAGHGGQWLGMGRALYAAESVFRAALDACDAMFQAKADWSLLEKLHDDGPDNIFSNTRFLQPAIFALQVGITRLLAHYGIRPKAVIGHSLGEIAACWASGGCSLEAACTIVLERSRLMDQQQLYGQMLLVKDQVEPYRAQLDAMALDIACLNGPNEFVVSGNAADIERFGTKLTADGVAHFALPTRLPFHSRYFDAASQALSASLGSLDFQRGDVADGCDFYSTVSGKKADPTQLDAAYWGKNVRSCVRFEDAVASAAADNYSNFIEIGSHPVLIHALKAILQSKQAAAAPPIVLSCLKKEQELRAFYQCLGQLFANGAAIDFDAMYPVRGECLHLPPYPFDKQFYWIKPDRVQPLLQQAVHASQAEPGAQSAALEAALSDPASRPSTISTNPADVKQTVRHMVQEALGRDTVADNDAFMSLGMDSLMSIGLCKELESVFRVSIDYRNFWTHASVQRLSDLILGTTDRRSKPLAKTLVSLHGRPDAPKKLVCFHCAGGNPAMFYDWQRVLPPDMALLAVQIPGRGALYDEATPATINALVESLTPYFFERLQGKQFYFVGHSMGGIVAYEMAQSLARLHQLTAAGLLVLASMAPAAVCQKTDFATGARDNLATLFPTYQQAIDPEVKANLVTLLLSDLSLLDTYRQQSEPPVLLPIISVVGNQDVVVDAAAMQGWETLSSHYRHHAVEADHSSILSNEAVFELVQQHLKQ